MIFKNQIKSLKKHNKISYLYKNSHPYTNLN